MHESGEGGAGRGWVVVKSNDGLGELPRTLRLYVMETLKPSL